MVVHDWDAVWPPQINHRIDILNWFITRAMAAVRRLTFSRDDLRLLYRAERALQLITERLTQTPSGKTPVTDNLQFYFRNAAKEIEQPSPAADHELPAVTVAPLVYIAEESPPFPEPIRFLRVAGTAPSALCRSRQKLRRYRAKHSRLRVCGRSDHRTDYHRRVVLHGL